MAALMVMLTNIQTLERMTKVTVVPKETTLTLEMTVVPNKTTPTTEMTVVPKEMTPTTEMTMVPEETTLTTEMTMVPEETTPTTEMTMVPEEMTLTTEMTMVPEETTPTTEMTMVHARGDDPDYGDDHGARGDDSDYRDDHGARGDDPDYGDGHGARGDDLDGQDGDIPLQFSLEEELHYCVRFEEGFNIPGFDPRYDAWLRLNHPEAVSTSFCVTPSKPHLSETSRSDASLSVTPTNLSKDAGRSPFSDLLNLPKSASTPKSTKTGRARVLTSSECLRLLREKEEQKQQVALEKGKRKLEREAKKKQKEEEQKRKANEKIRKANERALKAAERDQAKAKKAEERQKKAEERQRKAEEKQKTGQEKAPTKRNNATETGNRSLRKKSRLDMDETIHANLCCVCFGSFEEDIGTGREWLQCSCMRWIHEDCIDTDDIDSSTNKVCPLC